MYLTKMFNRHDKFRTCDTGNIDYSCCPMICNILATVRCLSRRNCRAFQLFRGKLLLMFPSPLNGDRSDNGRSNGDTNDRNGCQIYRPRAGVLNGQINSFHLPRWTTRSDRLALIDAPVENKCFLST